MSESKPLDPKWLIKPIIDRFWSNVYIGDKDECWPWIGTILKSGYGQFILYDTIKYRPHRFAYTVTKGPIPVGLLVCHSCDNPVCVNPAHLWLGTSQENTQDKVNKNRQCRDVGDASPHHKLTENEALYAYNSPKSRDELAEELNVSYGCIRKIKEGKTWGWLTKHGL